MKNLIKIFGLITLSAVIVFSLTAAACGSKSSGGTASGGSGPLAGHWFYSQEDAQISLTAAQNKMPDAWKGTIGASVLENTEAYWVTPNEAIIFPSYSFMADRKLLAGGFVSGTYYKPKE